MKVGVKRKVGVDVDWRVEWLIVETQKGVRVSEGKRAKKVRWVPTTTTLVIVFVFCIVEDLSLCLCFVRGNTAHFFNPFFL